MVLRTAVIFAIAPQSIVTTMAFLTAARVESNAELLRKATPTLELELVLENLAPALELTPLWLEARERTTRTKLLKLNPLAIQLLREMVMVMGMAPILVLAVWELGFSKGM